jgi:hypothetical protein
MFMFLVYRAAAQLCRSAESTKFNSRPTQTAKIPMKKTALILSTVLVLAFTGTLVAQQSSAKGNGTHLGTWQLLSAKYGDAKDFEDYPKERQRIKLITATHFNWVDYDTKTKKVSSSAGGPYSYREGVYIETIEFVGEGMETYLGKKQEFKIRIDGDKLFQSGQLSDGLKIEEVWQRVK